MPSSRTEGPGPSRVRLAQTLRRTGALAASGTGEECILTPAADAGPAPGQLALNRTGAWIWERLDGRASGLDLVEALVVEFDLEPERARRDYLTLVDRLLELGAVAEVATPGDEPG